MTVYPPIKTECITKENIPLLPEKVDILQGDNEPRTKSYAPPTSSSPVHLQAAVFKSVVAEGTSPDVKETTYYSELDHQPNLDIPAPPLDCEHSVIQLKNLQVQYYYY